MKHLFIMCAIILMVACGNDVTGPEGPEDPNPNEHSVLLHAEIFGGFAPDWILGVGWFDGTTFFHSDTLGGTWETEFTAISGDSIYVVAGVVYTNDDWICHSSISVDGEVVATSPTTGFCEDAICSYIIP